MKSLTRQEVASHNKSGDAWIIIDSLVYDISKFAIAHPGGEYLILEYAGQDCTKDFFELHRQQVLEKYQKLVIGSIVNENQKYNLDSTALSQVPYGEPSHLQGFHSRYYSESHRNYRMELRKFFKKLLKDFDLEGKQEVPLEVSKKVLLELGKHGVIATDLGQL